MLGRRKNLMFGREFVLQCWRKSFRKKRCNCCCFSGCVSLFALLYSTFFVNEILSFIANQKKRRFQLVARFSQCCIRHIYRETNICANNLIMFFSSLLVFQFTKKKKKIYIYIYIPINSKALFGKCD